MVLPGGGELTPPAGQKLRTMWKVKFLLGWAHDSTTGVRSQAEGRFTSLSGCDPSCFTSSSFGSHVIHVQGLLPPRSVASLFTKCPLCCQQRLSSSTLCHMILVLGTARRAFPRNFGVLFSFFRYVLFCFVKPTLKTTKPALKTPKPALK